MIRSGDLVRCHDSHLVNLFKDMWPEMCIDRVAGGDEVFLVVRTNATPRGHMLVASRTGTHLINKYMVKPT